MYHQNLFMVEILARARQEELIKYSLRSNRPVVTKAKRVTLSKKILLSFGEVLILWGRWIKERYQPECCPDSAVFQTDSANIRVS